VASGPIYMLLMQCNEPYELPACCIEKRSLELLLCCARCILLD